MASLVTDAPFSTDFSGCNTLQAMGSTVAASDKLRGVPGSMIIDDGWFKATIRQSDPATNLGVRSEITLTAQALGDETWIEWEMLIKSSEWTDHTGQIVLGQMHNQDDIQSAVNFSFWAINGEFLFNVPRDEPPTEANFSVFHYIEKLRLDHIYKVVVHTKWINNNTGFMEVFVDGIQIYKKWNYGTAYNADAPYFKLGIYDGPHLLGFGTKSARFRNMKRWSGPAALSAFLIEPPRPKLKLTGD